MKEVSQKALREAVEQLYKCSARHTGTEHVTEIFQGETAWDGDVHVFALAIASGSATTFPNPRWTACSSYTC